MDIGTTGEEIDVESNEQAELDAETQEVGDDRADGDHQTGEVHLTEHRLVGGEGRGCLVQAVAEVEPTDITSHIEQCLRNTIGTHLGDAAEDNHIHDDRQHRLDDVPQRTEDGLLVLNYDVSLDEQGD